MLVYRNGSENKTQFFPSGASKSVLIKITAQQCGIMYVVIVLRNDFEQVRETIILGISQRGNICQKRLAETILSLVELFG